MKRIYPILILPLFLALSGCGNIDWLPDNTKPQQFSFSEQKDVEVNKTVTSEPVTVTGNKEPAVITVTNGEYAIGGDGGDGAFTSRPGKVKAGQTVTVRHLSASSNEASVSTVVSIDGVTAVFTSVTKPLDSDPSGTIVLTAGPEFAPGPSDSSTVTGDLSFEFHNTSATESFTVEVSFVAKDAAGNIVYSGSCESQMPYEPDETSELLAPISLSPSVYSRIVKWRLTGVTRIKA